MQIRQNSCLNGEIEEMVMAFTNGIYSCRVSTSLCFILYSLQLTSLSFLVKNSEFDIQLTTRNDVFFLLEFANPASIGEFITVIREGLILEQRSL